MMNDGSADARMPSQDNRPNSSDAYLERAAAAVAAGDGTLGIHLYLAAYEQALRENLVPSDDSVAGMAKAWDLAIQTKQRSLAEYIFEKLEPYWNAEETAHHAEQLQRLAFDKLEEYGFDREAIEDMAEMVNQDLFDLVPNMTCQFDDEREPAPAQNDDQESDRMTPTAALAALGLAPAEAAQPPATPKQEPQRFDYRQLVGFNDAIRHMGTLGVGRSRDSEFVRFVHMLNERHGLPGIPALGTMMFSCPAREDANYFMVATVGELAIPAIRMRLDHNAFGQVILCVMASPDFKSRLSGISRGGFDSPTAVILEDLDLWDLPFMDPSFDDPQTFLQMQLSRGAREALAMIQTALSSPEATVFISAAEPDEIDPYFWDLIGDCRMIDIDLPNDAERKALWRSSQGRHPSLRGLDVHQLVHFSQGLSRFEISSVADEAVEGAYRESLAKNRFCAVRTEDMLAYLADFQPLDSDEYKRMEDLAVESLRRSTSDFDDLLRG